MRAFPGLGLLVGLWAVSLPAQGGVPIVVGGGGFGVSFGRGHFTGGLYLGGYPSGYYSSSVTIYSPGVVYRPASSYPPTTSLNVMATPAPEPGTDLRDEDFPDKIIIRPGKKTVKVPAIRPEAIRPPDEGPPGQPEMRPPPPLPREPEPAPPKAPWWPGLPEKVVPPIPDPAHPEARLQFDLGKQAFADPLREYARAEQRFARAVAVDPESPLSYFLLGQAQFALGKYREAVASIHAGLRLNPNWPSSRFAVRDLYGPNAEDFDRHLRLLQESLARRPNDPALLFLYAYELWFTGRQEDARGYFQRALPLVTEPIFFRMFLQTNAPPLAAK